MTSYKQITGRNGKEEDDDNDDDDVDDDDDDDGSDDVDDDGSDDVDDDYDDYDNDDGDEDDDDGNDAPKQMTYCQHYCCNKCNFHYMVGPCFYYVNSSNLGSICCSWIWFIFLDEYNGQTLQARYFPKLC